MQVNQNLSPTANSDVSSNNNANNPFRDINLRNIVWEKFTCLSTANITQIEHIDSQLLHAYQSFITSLTHSVIQSTPPRKSDYSNIANKGPTPVWWNSQCNQADSRTTQGIEEL